MGTVFIHALANLLTTMATSLTLTIEPSDGISIEEVIGRSSSMAADGKSAVVTVSAINFGQPKHILVRMNAPNGSLPYLRATLAYKELSAGNEEVQESVLGLSWEGAKIIAAQQLRLAFVNSVINAMKKANKGNHEGAVNDMKELVRRIRDSPVAGEGTIQDLLRDVEGQATEALSNQTYFRRWGRHYLPSLLGAHLGEQCNNFKDPGVQHYAGQLFGDLRDEIDATFMTLPPPKPSRPRPAMPSPSHVDASGHSSRSPSLSSARPVSMRYYNSRRYSLRLPTLPHFAVLLASLVPRWCTWPMVRASVSMNWSRAMKLSQHWA